MSPTIVPANGEIHKPPVSEPRLEFGQPRPRQLRNKKRVEPEQSLALELPDAQTTSRWAHNPNPCVAALGLGPEGATCKTCVHLFRKTFGKTYLKCDLRPNTNGAGTDHRAGWDACGKYAPLTPEPTPAAAVVDAAANQDDRETADIPWWNRD